MGQGGRKAGLRGGWRRGGRRLVDTASDAQRGERRTAHEARYLCTCRGNGRLREGASQARPQRRQKPRRRTARRLSGTGASRPVVRGTRRRARAAAAAAAAASTAAGAASRVGGRRRHVGKQRGCRRGGGGAGLGAAWQGLLPQGAVRDAAGATRPSRRRRRRRRKQLVEGGRAACRRRGAGCSSSCRGGCSRAGPIRGGRCGHRAAGRLAQGVS